MRRSAFALVPLCLLALTSACKPTSEGGGGDSSLNADAAKVASGEEILLTENSNPPPQPSPKLGEGALDPKRNALTDAFPREKVGEFQVAGSDLTGTPRELQGIWWMDGNPLPDETVSFAKADFSQEKPLYPVFGENNFSFHAGATGTSDFPQGDGDFKAGRAIYNLASSFAAVYEFVWTGTGGSKYNSAKIIPTFRLKVGPIEKWLRLSPKIMEFTMVKKGEHLYSRDNTIFGKPADGYDLRRILVPSASDPRVLEKTEWWASYAKQPSPLMIRLAAKKGN